MEVHVCKTGHTSWRNQYFREREYLFHVLYSKFLEMEMHLYNTYRCLRAPSVCNPGVHKSMPGMWFAATAEPNPTKTHYLIWIHDKRPGIHIIILCIGIQTGILNLCANRSIL